jgi:predicted histidine transporter YuiF (NhaC family)
MEIATLCISLLSFFAALAAVIVPIVIYKKQRKYEAEKEEQTKKEMARREREDAQAELDAMGINSSPFSLSGYSKMEKARAKYLWKKTGRR